VMSMECTVDSMFHFAQELLRFEFRMYDHVFCTVLLCRQVLAHYNFAELLDNVLKYSLRFYLVRVLGLVKVKFYKL
jgi:hypothetical protein